MRINHKLLLAIIYICLVLFKANAQILNQLQIKHILINHEEKGKASNFSIKITLYTGNNSLKNWNFGFYMPRNFRKTSQRNRNLSMKICELGSSNCSRLAYLKAPFTSPDFSALYTTIVAPAKNYPLKAGKTYILSFLNASSKGPQNYSSLPQNIFILDKNKNNIINIPTTPAIYSLIGYNPSQIRNDIQDHINRNWANSSSTKPLISVIPEPISVTQTDDSSFNFGNTLTIHDFSQMQDDQLKLWKNTLKADLKLLPKLDHMQSNDGILLENKNISVSNPEGYEIEINPRQIKIMAHNEAGFFYALQTLRQLWFKADSIRAMKIKDYPKFKYRGILLDVARHYFTIKELKNFIDIMAALKLNTLHLHLSDDEAFRLALDDYPKLGQIGANRGIGHAVGPLAFVQKNLSKNLPSDKIPTADTIYAGSYSSSSLEDLLNYANLRQITVIPEIDIPGHSRALMKALPDKLYEPGDKSEYTGYGDNSLPVCAYDSPSSFGQKFSTTLANIIFKTTQIFTHQSTLYAINDEISIGGDEVFNGTWDKAPSCQIKPWKTMNALAKEHYFLDRLNNDARISKLKLSGWHEFVLDKNNRINFKHGISPQEIGHVWVWGKADDSLRKAIILADLNYPVVLEYSDLLYMDMTYTPDVKEPGLYWANKSHDTYTTLSAMQAAAKTQQQTRHPEQILGLEGALWTDVIPSYYHLQYMAFPKIAGLAEASWSQPDRNLPNWHSLANRLGCGKTGFLAFINAKFNANYRGYPKGISLEAPQACNTVY